MTCKIYRKQLFSEFLLICWLIHYITSENHQPIGCNVSYENIGGNKTGAVLRHTTEYEAKVMNVAKGCNYRKQVEIIPWLNFTSQIQDSIRH